MNYEEMSDHDINMAVTCIANNLKGWEVSASNISFYHCGIDGSEFHEVYVADYCSNPDYAWSIIVANKIDIQHRSAVKTGCVASLSGDSDIYHISYNPLRAAMIVFLMINDGGAS